MGLFDFKKKLVSRDPYGMYFVEGSFGSGKSYNTFLEAKLDKDEDSNLLVIANTPYDFVDLYYSSYEDFTLILKYFYRFFLEQNSRLGVGFPRVRWIIDESHIYFFTREFRSFDKKLVFLMTQVRKVRLSFYIISQRRKQVDSFVRELAPESIYYTTGSFFMSWLKTRSLIYYGDSDSNNVDEAEEISKTFLFPPFLDKLLYKKHLSSFRGQKYLTNYLVGLEHIHMEPKKDEKTGKEFAFPVLTYDQFLTKIAPFYPFIYEDYEQIEKPVVSDSTFQSKRLLQDDEYLGGE